MTKEHKTVIIGWLLKARQDYLTYQLICASGQALADTAAFHAQQAAEKWLKGLIVCNYITPPRFHNLLLLVGYLEPFYPELLDDQWAKHCQVLNEYAIEIRYYDPASPAKIIFPDLAETSMRLEAFRTFAKEKYGSLWVE